MARLMMPSLYDALIKAGAGEEHARSAATDVADNQAETQQIRSDLRLLKWMVGINITATIGILIQTFF